MQRRTLLSRLLACGVAFTAATWGAWNANAQSDAAASHTLVLWRDGQAGRRLEVRGRVADAARKPLQGAQVTVRHSDPQGDYTGQYEGAMTTNARGEYVLRTAMPGSYGRPLHIHVTASHPQAGYEYTEIVFRGDRMLDADSQQFGIVLETVRLNDIEVLVGTFDIVIGKP